MCYFDLLTRKNVGDPPPTKCNCPPQWTGERCETAVNVCENMCLNGGTCYIIVPGVLPFCNCPEGFTGPKCENCLKHVCKNNGTCFRNEKGQEQCNCLNGYKGSQCQISECQDYCKNQGACAMKESGPVCTCRSSHTGKRCELDACFDHCLNGGICHPSLKQMICECPDRYAGKRCETDVCKFESPPSFCHSNKVPDQCITRAKCQNGGTCEVINGNALCRCHSTYGGVDCEKYIGYGHTCETYCHNNAICTLMDPTADPICTCLNGWQGRTCADPNRCDGYCYNDGQCQEPEDENSHPTCWCGDGLSGDRCEKIDILGTKSRTATALTAVATSIGILLLIIGLVGGGCYVFKKHASGKLFMHARLTDNVEITNPMYQEEIGDDSAEHQNFTTNLDKGNFANPVYDSMYKNVAAGEKSPSGLEEKKGLLQYPQDSNVNSNELF